MVIMVELWPDNDLDVCKKNPLISRGIIKFSDAACFHFQECMIFLKISLYICVHDRTWKILDSSPVLVLMRNFIHVASGLIYES